MRIVFLLIAAATLLAQTVSAQENYRPTPQNMESRREFAQTRFGIFIHWGLYSMLGDGEWIMHTNSDGNLNHYECSVCHMQQGHLSNYCEDCGAKMDKKDDAK
jgi:alpha-L-fucosidase